MFCGTRQLPLMGFKISHEKVCLNAFSQTSVLELYNIKDDIWFYKESESKSAWTLQGKHQESHKSPDHSLCCL